MPSSWLAFSMKPKTFALPARCCAVLANYPTIVQDHTTRKLVLRQPKQSRLWSSITSQLKNMRMRCMAIAERIMFVFRTKDKKLRMRT